MFCRIFQLQIPEILNQNKPSTRFFISNTFISNTKLKLAKNKAKAKKHPQDEY